MKLVNRTVEKAIKAKFGWDAKLFYDDDGGYYHFYSDDELQQNVLMNHIDSPSVWVYRLNHLSLDQWLESFEELFHGSDWSAYMVKQC